VETGGFAMPDNETGFKWWLRYVLVPIIGGGGIVAIIVAFVRYLRQSRRLEIWEPLKAAWL
jgi:threonine dehydratase